jgi:prepilin-type N-terminal cleavage/methylation domain-containing protein
MKRQSGFTLVEIAIVLVVIGLLLGGVLKGQELVLNAQIRNAINEYNNVASARFAYQDRYRQIPGDDNTASTRWNNVVDGNGDRTITGNWDNNDGTQETSIFWHHLRNDGLVVGARLNTQAATFELPRNSFDGDIGIQTGALSIFVDTICQSNIPARAAIIIDTRIDDDPGDGTGGSTGSLQASTGTVGVGDAPENYDTTTAVNRYTMCREL